MKFPLIAYFNLLSNIFPIGAGLYKWRYLKKEYLLFFIYVVVSGISELTTYITARYGIKNIFVFPVYSLIEYCLLVFIFEKWLKWKGFKTIIRGSIILYVIFCGLSLIMFDTFTASIQIIRSVSSVIFIFLAAVALLDLMKGKRVNKESRFWIITGIMIYFAGNSILFIFSGIIPHIRIEDAMTMWTVHWSSNVFVNICYMTAFLCLRSE